MDIYILVFSLVLFLGWIVLKLLNKPLDQTDVDVLLAFVTLVSLAIKHKVTTWLTNRRQAKERKNVIKKTKE